MNPLFAGILGLGPQEILLLLVLGVLFFGRNLPSVGRSLGKSIVEFKKGIKGLEDEVDNSISRAESTPPALDQPRPPQRVAATTPKFEENPSAVSTPPKFN